MTSSTQALGSLVIILSLAVPLSAQSAKPKTAAGEKAPESGVQAETGNREPALTLQQQHALGLLDQLFDQAKGFKDEQSKVRVQAQVADLLWDYDEVRARRQFEDAFKAIEAVKSAQASPFTFAPDSEQSRLRTEILRRVSSRDPGLVEKLIKSVPETQDKHDPFTALFGGQSRQADLFLDLATELALTDPQGAAQLVQRGLSGGISLKLVTTLQVIRAKEPQLADGLFGQALGVASRSGAPASGALMFLASYVFPQLGNAGMQLSREAGSVTLPPNPALIQQFLNFAFETIVRQADAAPPAQNPADDRQFMAEAAGMMNYTAVQLLLPFFDQYQPDKAAVIRTRLGQINNRIPEQGRTMMEGLISSFSGQTTVTDLIRKAENETQPAQKDMLYMMAAQRACQEGDVEQALRITDKISLEMMRSTIASSVRFQAAMLAASRGDAEGVYRYAKDLPSLTQRALVFSQLALKLLDKHDLARAVEVLDDAEKMIDRGEDGPGKARAMVDIATVKAGIDPVRGFESMRSAVEAINRTDFDAQLSGFPAIAMPGAVIERALKLDTIDFDQSFPVLARQDFHGALLLAQGIKKKELSAAAQLSVCRGVLTRDRPPADKEKSKEPTRPSPTEQKKPRPPNKADRG